MRRRKSSSSCLLLAILLVITWYTASSTSRPYASSTGYQLHQYTPEVASHFRQELRRNNKDGVVYGREEVMGELSRLGSRPPICKDKCQGCKPCDAIQIPETEAKGHHLHVQYANYEPEGWKCKCGLTIFSP